MKCCPILLWVLLCMPALAGSAEPSVASPHVHQATIGVKPYRDLFVAAGIGDDFPQLVIYSPQGRCLGSVFLSDPDTLVQKIEELLDDPKPGCGAVLSSEFGVTAPREGAGLGRIAVQLLTLDAPFCTACAGAERALAETAGNDQGSRVYVLTKVSLGEGFNPRVDAEDGTCAACQDH